MLICARACACVYTKSYENTTISSNPKIFRKIIGYMLAGAGGRVGRKYAASDFVLI